MLTEDEMTVNERRKYLKRMQVRYAAAKRAERGSLLTEMQQVIVRVWESRDYICAERLTPGLLTMAQHLARFEPLGLTRQVQEQLATISRATVARILRKYRARVRRLPQKGAERANSATQGVPMGRISWEVSEPGHFEVDLVYHSGESTAGLHGHTIQLIDVATGWSERAAVLGRGQRAMEEGFAHILERLPFPIKELHPDNGSEFFNHHLVRFWKEKVVGVTLSRSRPYQKNDNRFVEQKNDSLVREYLGHLRFDTTEQVEAINLLYERMWLYYNLFQPVLHLSKKELVGDKVRRTWDEAQTPYQRLLATGVLSREPRERLQALYEQTNPLTLRHEIYQRLTELWNGATSQAAMAA